MPTMLKRLIHITFLVALATAASAQYLPGTLSGGTGVPGTKTRSPLTSMERAANNLQGITIVTDTFGNQRLAYYVRVLDTCVNYNPLLAVGNLPLSSFVYQCGTQDSLFYIDWKADAVLVSIGGGQSVNWYNTDDTTTAPLRTATIDSAAQWIGDNPSGFLYWEMGSLAGGRLLVDTASALYHTGVGGLNIVRTDAQGIDIATSNTASRAVNITSDTVNMISSFDPTLMRVNLLSDGTYFHADSLKVVGVGQFPGFPSINFDGTENGFFYDPQSNGVVIIQGDGLNGGYAFINLFDNLTSQFFEYGTSIPSVGQVFTENNIMSTSSNYLKSVINDDSEFGELNYRIYQNNASESYFRFYNVSADTNVSTLLNFGSGIPEIQGRAFSIATNDDFFWVIIELPNDTTNNKISFYNRAYYWRNEHPTGAAGDTLFHFWAATGPGGEAGKDPGFITLDDIRAGVINWYNSNGTTTDNTRIATVTETATWLSNDVTADGVYPFRFELSGGGANEPENMVWLFPAGDSATLSQSDQELILFSSNQWLFKSNEATTVQADSFQYNPNLGGTAFRVGDNNVITQNAPSGTTTHRDAIEYRTITGTAQTELFLDGSADIWVVPTNSASNFKIHVAAICSAAGDGVGINTGDAWASWHLGGIKRVGSTTSLIGSVQAAATAQSDAGMSTSVVTIDADDTDESLRIRFTPPSTAGSTTVIRVVATIEISQTSY